jgi:hypothetical protein
MSPPMTAARVRRKFRLSDAIVMVAGVALGLAWLRFMMNDRRGDWHFLPDSRERWARFLHAQYLPALFVPVLPCLAILTLALMALRLVGPRPNSREFATQPGSIVLFSASVVLLISMTAAVVIGINYFDFIFPLPGSHSFLAELTSVVFWHGVEKSSEGIAFATITAWSVQLLGRRCFPERTWIDRAGLAVGIAWLFAGGCVWWFDRILGGYGILRY